MTVGPTATCSVGSYRHHIDNRLLKLHQVKRSPLLAGHVHRPGSNGSSEGLQRLVVYLVSSDNAIAVYGFNLAPRNTDDPR